MSGSKLPPPTPFSSPVPTEEYESLTPGAQEIVNSFARQSSSFLKALSAPHHHPWTFDIKSHPLASYFATQPLEIGWHQHHVDHHTFIRGWFVDSGLAAWIAFHRHQALLALKSATETAPTIPDERLSDKNSYDVEAALCLITLAFNYGVLHFKNGIYSFESMTGEPMTVVHELLTNSTLEHSLELKLLEAIGECHADIVKGITPGTMLSDLKRCLPLFHAHPDKFEELPCNDVVKAAIESYEEWIPAFDNFQKKLDDKQTAEEKEAADRRWEEMKVANGWKAKGADDTSAGATGTSDGGKTA
jgi:hypothetical protein